jgi:hypothetical protein
MRAEQVVKRPALYLHGNGARIECPADVLHNAITQHFNVPCFLIHGNL